VKMKGRLSENESRDFFKQIVVGLEYSHKTFIAHRDMKPENVFIQDSKTIKIGDWGFADTFDSVVNCGSLDYAAPEIMNFEGVVGPESDIWAIGVIVYYMVSGNMPFSSSNEFDIIAKIKKGKYTKLYDASPEFQDLIKELLRVNPKKRATLDEIKEHPWFLGITMPPKQLKRIKKRKQKIRHTKNFHLFLKKMK